MVLLSPDAVLLVVTLYLFTQGTCTAPQKLSTSNRESLERRCEGTSQHHRPQGPTNRAFWRRLHTAPHFSLCCTQHSAITLVLARRNLSQTAAGRTTGVICIACPRGHGDVSGMATQSLEASYLSVLGVGRALWGVCH